MMNFLCHQEIHLKSKTLGNKMTADYISYKCSLTIVILELYICRQKEGTYISTVLSMSIWIETFAFGNNSGASCWVSETRKG